jgi:SAM-dependent methyltransferase
MSDAARRAPAAARNRDPILQVLRAHLPRPGRVLEIASGTGEHAVWFSRALPEVIWQPTDHDPEALASIAAWRAAEGLTNVLPPLLLDTTAADTWPVARVDAVVSINMIQNAPGAATEGLMTGAARVLRTGGSLYLYGPFREGAAMTAGNAAFDLDLRARNPEWGVRDLAEVSALALRRGLALAERITMPANNLSVIFRRC